MQVRAMLFDLLDTLLLLEEDERAQFTLIFSEYGGRDGT